MTRFISYIVLCTILFFIPSSLRGDSSSLFHIRQSPKGCFVEIPKRLMGRDFLLAARIMTLSSPNNKAKLYAGQRLYDPIWIRFRHDKEQLYMLRPDTKSICTDSTDHSYPAYARNAVTPIAESWKIEQETDSSIVVNWGKFLSDPIPGVDPFGGKMAPGRLLPQLNKIVDIKAHEHHLEVSVQYGFDGALRPFLTTVRKSLLLLPEQPMQPRLHDERVGFAHTPKRTFHLGDLSISSVDYINRFRLNPAPKDVRNYLKGKLVKPERPIVFYIDDAFPPLWKRAIRQGILDWNKAFEAIGFKEVMQVKSYAEAGDGFDPDDIRFNCFRYVISDFPNAMGKHWIDPRSGEILQADVLFHSNVLSLLRKWYFLQTAAYNPTARNKELPDEVTTRLIRYAAAHEIGHCLGLEHNFKASYAYDTELLRRPDFTERHGTTPSIMDYARFNYVAQPGDNVQNVFPPLLGVYDRYAIRIGYTYLPKEDHRIVSSWIDEQQNNPMYQYGRMKPSPIASDPTIQTSDLGNDPVASATYGIRNLRVLLEHLPEWTQTRPGKNPFEDMPATFDDLRTAYFAHLDRVLPFIGFNGYAFSEKAADFLRKELVSGSRFLMTKSVVAYTDDQTSTIIKEQKDIISKMFGKAIAERVAANEDITGFRYADYLAASAKQFFAEQKPDLQLRNLQEAYIRNLKTLEKELNGSSPYSVLLCPVINKHLTSIREQLSTTPSTWNRYLIKQLP